MNKFTCWLAGDDEAKAWEFQGGDFDARDAAEAFAALDDDWNEDSEAMVVMVRSADGVEAFTLWKEVVVTTRIEQLGQDHINLWAYLEAQGWQRDRRGWFWSPDRTWTIEPGDQSSIRRIANRDFEGDISAACDAFRFWADVKAGRDEAVPANR